MTVDTRTQKRFLTQEESAPWLRKRIRLSIHFREMSEGAQPLRLSFVSGGFAGFADR